MPFARIGRARNIAAWFTAIIADAIQIVLFPIFGPGFVSPWDDAVDLAVGAILVALLGWHWAFAPALLAEIVPGVDLIPTWTAAVFLATRTRRDKRPAG